MRVRARTLGFFSVLRVGKKNGITGWMKDICRLIAKRQGVVLTLRMGSSNLIQLCDDLVMRMDLATTRNITHLELTQWATEKKPLPEKVADLMLTALMPGNEKGAALLRHQLWGARLLNFLVSFIQGFASEVLTGKVARNLSMPDCNSVGQLTFAILALIRLRCRPDSARSQDSVDPTGCPANAHGHCCSGSMNPSGRRFVRCASHISLLWRVQGGARWPS